MGYELPNLGALNFVKQGAPGRRSHPIARARRPWQVPELGHPRRRDPRRGRPAGGRRGANPGPRARRAHEAPRPSLPEAPADRGAVLNEISRPRRVVQEPAGRGSGRSHPRAPRGSGRLAAAACPLRSARAGKGAPRYINPLAFLMLIHVLAGSTSSIPQNSSPGNCVDLESLPRNATYVILGSVEPRYLLGMAEVVSAVFLSIGFESADSYGWTLSVKSLR